MDLEKAVYTTFEAAKICYANITSIKNWIDQGELAAFRTPGGHYRIEQRELDGFLTRHGMPNPFAKKRRKQILVVQRDRELFRRLVTHFGDEHDYDWTDDALDAVLRIGRFKPDVAVVDAAIEELDVIGLCARIREHDDLKSVHLVALYDPKRDEDYAEKLRAAGAGFALERNEAEAGVLKAVTQIVSA